MNVFRFLKGYVCVFLTGDELPRLIRICISRGIFLWDVVSKDAEHMQAKLYGCDVWKLHEILHKTRTKIKIRKKIGLPFLYYKYRKKAGYVFGISAMLLLLFYLSGFIWIIQVHGNAAITEETITKYLNNNEQGIGAKKKSIDTDMLEKQLLQDFPQMIWVSAHFKGSTLHIAIKEQIEESAASEDQMTEGMDLLAPIDGIVDAMYVRDGTAAVKQGDAVQKGDVLIYGWIPILNDSGDQVLQYINKNADGDVQILGDYVFSYEEKLAYEKRISTGEQREYIIVGTNHSNLNLIPYMLGRTTHTTMTKVKQLRFGGVLPLPIYCNHLTEKSYILQQSTHSKKEMQDIMQKHLFDLNKNFKEKGIQIVDKNVIMEYGSDSCVMQGTLILRVSASEKRMTELPQISLIKEMVNE